MKKYILFLLIGAFSISCSSSKKDKMAKDAESQKVLALKDKTTVQIIDSVFNFKNVTDGEQVEYSYRFKNTGSNPLVILEASASCGCTVPQKPERPIAPGEIGFIKVVFDSKGRAGSAHKTVTVVSNASPEFPQLVLTGEVLAKNKEN